MDELSVKSQVLPAGGNPGERGVVYRSHFHRAYSLTGPDALDYLHRRTSQTFQNFSENELRKSLVLSPQGKVEGVFYAIKERDKILLLAEQLVEVVSEQAFLEAYSCFKVADQFDLYPLNDHSVLIVSSKNPEAVFQTKVPNLYEVLELSGELKCTRFCDVPVPAFMVIGKVEHLDVYLREISQSPALQELSSSEERDFQRINAGIPLIPVDIGSNTSALELDLSTLVSRTKGCYPGQEVVEKGSSFGQVGRVIRAFKISEEITVGAELLVEGKKVGSVTSVAPFPDSSKSYGIARIKADAIEKKIQISTGTQIELS